ncbi:MAG: hypothetical protein HYX57_10830 [Chloroflexi bacterium]|nr:hypothetical protein [Chloroflexota bacterium]
MKTTIDKAGRLVIPRLLRDRIGLGGGGEVELELDGAAIRQRPRSERGTHPARHAGQRTAARNAASRSAQRSSTLSRPIDARQRVGPTIAASPA